MYTGETHDARIQTVLRELGALPPNERAQEALAVAAASVEYAAYEMARTNAPSQVAQLILCAADLERVSQALRDKVRRN